MSNLLHFPAPPTAASDAPAREAALDIRQSCIIEAPAGSGKTGLLMQRFLKLLAEADLDRPEEVLAITFTNKATAELRDRVFAQLSDAARMTPLPPDASSFDQTTRDLASAVIERGTALGWSILDRPNALNIRTIDAVCAEIAGSLPLLSGSGGSRKPTTDAAPLYRLAAERTLFQLGGPDAALHEALRTVLLHRDASLSDVQSLLADMLSQRDQWADFLPLGPNALDDETLDREVRARLERTLELIVCSTLTRAANAMPPGMLHQLTELASQLGLNPGYKGERSPIAFCADLRLPPEERADHLDHWHALIGLLLTKDREGVWRKSFNVNVVGFEMSKAEKQLLQSLIDAHKSDKLCAALCAVRELPDARYPEPQWQVIKALFRVLRHALAELKVIFAERDECDFIEIALAARNALEAPDPTRAEDNDAIDLALSAGGKLRHLLVDEMQDTSATQYDLIHQLTRSWDGASQTLFLVGDPKQSIYLFRQARVERFLRTMHQARFGDMSLQALRLTSNFRSQAGLVHAFNASFAQIFPSPQSAAGSGSSDVPFVAATPVRAATPTAGIDWHATLFDPQTFSRREHEAAQAREIRQTIERWLATRLPPGRTKPWSIAVLARARRHLEAIIAEFKRDDGAGPLAFHAVDIDCLAERPEILDVLALTRALLHPADRTAWLAVLHAPWCGLGLADLLTLTDEGPSADPQATVAHLVASRTHLLSPEAQHLLGRAWPILQAAIDTVGQTSFATHVERTWRSLGGDAPLSLSERSNVIRFLAVLNQVQTDVGYPDLRTLNKRLRDLYAEPAAGPCSVDLLTIHKAKGLEWDVVLVPSLERRGASSFGDLLNWMEVDTSGPDNSGIVLAPIGSKGSEVDKLNRWLNSAREARENAERKRLFYVLNTRAREELHLFGAVRRKEDGTPAGAEHGSLLKAIWPAAEPAFSLASATGNSVPNLKYNLIDALVSKDVEEVDETISIAASIDTLNLDRPPVLHRMPIAFDPVARFDADSSIRLPYPPAYTLHAAANFARPEGSYSVRAFGNVVHRFLQLLSTRLEANPQIAALFSELPGWAPRLTASFRAEGVPPAALPSLTQRALDALRNALTDPVGCWILSPHAEAHSEQALRLSASGELRVDRTFLAGAGPLSTGSSHLWIVDFKTTEQGSRSDALFEAQEREKYSAQLSTYAHVQRALPGTPQTIMLALFYPLSTRLISWVFVT